MVFEKITLFEPHFDGANFDARFGDKDNAREEETVDRDVDEHVETDQAGGRSLVGPVVATLAIAAVATLLARRFLGGDEVDEQYEFDESIEGAAGQSAD